MEKQFLEKCLAKGMSLEAIGEAVGKHPSTVAHWLKKLGLRANGAEKYASRGPLCLEQLRPLVDSGATLAEMAERLDRSPSTIRYWLSRYEIKLANPRGPRRRSGSKTATFECGRHGMTEFTLEGRGHYRCKRCRSAAVADRRRRIKRQLVKEAGGACALCGYRRWVGALQSTTSIPAARISRSAREGTLGHWLEAEPRSVSAFCSARTAMPRWRAGSLPCRWICGLRPAVPKDSRLHKFF
jgi:transposase